VSLAEIDPAPVRELPSAPRRAGRPLITSGASPSPAPDADPAHRTPSRLVVAPDAVPDREPRRLPFALTVLTLLGLGLGGLLFLNTAMQQDSFQVSRLTDQSAVLAAQQQALAEQLDRLRSPQSLADRAAQQGLVRQTDPPILNLGTGTVSTRTR